MLRYHRHNLKKETRSALIFISDAISTSKKALRKDQTWRLCWTYSRISRMRQLLLKKYTLVAMLMVVRESQECCQNSLVTTKVLKIASKRHMPKASNMLECKLLIIALLQTPLLVRNWKRADAAPNACMMTV